MARKRKRRSGVVEIGTGPARVKIYTVNRKDGYPMFSLYWREDGRRQTKHLAWMAEASTGVPPGPTPAVAVSTRVM